MRRGEWMEGVVRREIGREEGERKDEKCWDKGKHDTHTHPPIEYHSSHVRKESPDQVHAHKIATCQRINLLLLCNRLISFSRGLADKSRLFGQTNFQGSNKFMSLFLPRMLSLNL